MRAEIPLEVRRELHDPRAVVRSLGLEAGSVRNGRNVLVRCPWHEEQSASCSVHVGRDGTIAVRCFGCGVSGDALALVAVSHGLDLRRDFVEVVIIGAELAGLWGLVDEIRGTKERRPAPPPRPRPEPMPERDYPPIAEVRALLQVPAWRDAGVRVWLTSRGIDPVQLEAASSGIMYEGIPEGAVIFALTPDMPLPSWARCKAGTWFDAGYRALVPMVHASGALRSVRVCRIVDADSPKRLPPSGHRASGLVMANELALALLRRSWRPSTDVRVAVRIVEGEPDFLTAVATRASIATAVVGIVSGSWSHDFATCIPKHALVAIQTHNDEAGDRYAAEIHSSLTTAGVAVLTRIAP